ncbi:MAG: hypothetical protein M0R51_10680 [Clostridia bacterium]|jgi:hypothetical protein|nr:hypothetical protein [Clostridia bacterium]
MVSFIQFVCLMIIVTGCMSGLILVGMQINSNPADIDPCVGIWKPITATDAEFQCIVFYENGKGHVLTNSINLSISPKYSRDTSRMDLITGGKYSPFYKSFTWGRHMDNVWNYAYIIHMTDSDTSIWVNIYHDDITVLQSDTNQIYNKVIES